MYRLDRNSPVHNLVGAVKFYRNQKWKWIAGFAGTSLSAGIYHGAITHFNMLQYNDRASDLNVITALLISSSLACSYAAYKNMKKERQRFKELAIEIENEKKMARERKIEEQRNIYNKTLFNQERGNVRVDSLPKQPEVSIGSSFYDQDKDMGYAKVFSLSEMKEDRQNNF